MATVKVKLAPRGARLHLNNEACKVKLNIAVGIFVTEPGIINNDYVKIKDFPELVNIRNISHIEIPVSRFTPDVKSFMEIAWDE